MKIPALNSALVFVQVLASQEDEQIARHTLGLGRRDQPDTSGHDQARAKCSPGQWPSAGNHSGVRINHEMP